jgi:putative flavoprotein involved in K+ transport
VNQVATPRESLRVGTTTAVVIGGGHAGLAMSRCLTDRSIDHVVIERGEVANSWCRERWDSLKLLTPNWLTRLPGHSYSGSYNGKDPDGFMDMPQVIDFIQGYARLIDAPVMTHTTVQSVRRCDSGYRVSTDRGAWYCRAVVIANGAFNIPAVPGLDAGIPDHIHRVTPNAYRNPDQLAQGGVLVVGASATGLQLADEIQRSGRPVAVAVGEHVRMPRTYRGLDIQRWMKRSGLLDENLHEVDDINRARRVPSPQLVGTDDRSTLDLNTLTDSGVELFGRLAGVNNGKAQFSGSLRNNCAMADLKMGRLLNTIDDWASGAGLEGSPAERFDPTRVPDAPRLSLDFTSGEIKTVVWATGFRPDYSWLDVPVFDRKGRLRHDGGVVDAPGLYTMGLNFMRRRKSSFIHGAEDDAKDLSAHLTSFLADSRKPLLMSG